MEAGVYAATVVVLAGVYGPLAYRCLMRSMQDWRTRDTPADES